MSGDEKHANALIVILKAIAGGLIGVVICTLMIAGRVQVAQVLLGTVSIVICAMFGCYRKNPLVTKVEIIVLIPIAIIFPVVALISGTLISVAPAVPMTSENIIVIIKLVLNSLTDPSMVIDNIEFYLGWGLGIVLTIVMVRHRLKSKITVRYNCDRSDVEKIYVDFFKQNNIIADTSSKSDAEFEKTKTENGKNIEMVYRSSPLVMFSNFIVPVIIAGILVFIALGKRDGSLIVDLIISIIAVVPAAVSVYVNFFRNNIKIKVSRANISFSRMGKEYLCFSHASFNFTSFVSKLRLNGIPMVSRYLRVTPKDEWKGKDYLCNNFDKKTFEDLIHYILSHRYEQGKSTGNQAHKSRSQYTGEKTEFVINKRLLLRKNMQRLLVALLAVGVAVLIIHLRDREFSIVFLSIFLITPLIAFSVPFYKIIRYTPKKIVLCQNCLMVDSLIINFPEIEQIRMTPPSYRNSTVESLFLSFQKMVIARQGITHTFIVGTFDYVAMTKKEKVFEGYERLCNNLQAVFMNTPDKFKLDLG